MSASQPSLSDFEHDGRRAFYRPNGYVEAGYLVDLITHVLHEALDKGIEQALVSITGVIGFESPGPTFRKWAVQRWADAVGGRMTVALVAKPEHVSPHKIGLVVAAEEGLNANIFTDEPDAIAW